MTEFIGSRISLISKRDIRYVGTLHEISSENSTVALENVTSYGTEGRRPDEEVPANLDNIYEYIVFRGSDVKDLRIEEGPKEAKKREPPKIPDDPAILGSTRKPTGPTALQSKPSVTPTAQSQTSGEQSANAPQGPPPSQPPTTRQQPPPFQHQPYPYQFSGPPQRFGPGGPGGPGGSGGFPPGPPGYGFPGMPYGAPPAWYPPQGFPHHIGPNQFPPPQMPISRLGQRQQIPLHHPPNNLNAASPGFSVPEEETKNNETKPIATVKLPALVDSPPPQQPSHGVSSPSSNEPKIDVATTPGPTEALPGSQQLEKIASKNGRIVPAIPYSPLSKKVASTDGATKSAIGGGEAVPMPATSKSLEEANRDARAAVAAAMAKLPSGEKKPADSAGAMESVTKAISELKTNETSRGSRGNRAGRGGNRGGRDQGRRVDVPKTDYDFESANAKFNKHDLAKEAIATGSPIEAPNSIPDGDGFEEGLKNARKGSEPGLSVPVGASYNRTSSFFDDISSEIKDRAENRESAQRVGGREFRHEERQKNLETFGQGSVDNNYRYGRGRGRGRGYGRGRGRAYDGRSGGRSSGRGLATSATVEGS